MTSVRTARIGVLGLFILIAGAAIAWGGRQPEEVLTGDYRVLAPITHGNLTIFPVVSDRHHDTHMFITLDEGLRSGQVVVSEAGQVQGLVRRRPVPLPWRDGAQVNRLVLVNNSDRPLLLLAGEIVTGGKQDRVVGKDRIVTPDSDPVDLSVFCVEPGRWTGTSAQFGGIASGNGQSGYVTQMAQPSVRGKAMADKNQQKVWSEVNRSVAEMAATPQAGVGSGMGGGVTGGSTSYARVMGNDEVQKKVDAVAAPVERSYESVIRQLRNRNAVGVVVAIDGEIVWADIFASTPLLEKYWPKLVRSYATEAITRRGKKGSADVKTAQAFLDDFSGNREVVETEPGVFRHTEIVGSGFHAFELTSLLPKTGFDVHISKMSL
jgi:ARG and Rhodanese-Phosphatase-superfamily-associated Protein domain